MKKFFCPNCGRELEVLFHCDEKIVDENDDMIQLDIYDYFCEQCDIDFTATARTKIDDED